MWKKFKVDREALPKVTNNFLLEGLFMANRYNGFSHPLYKSPGQEDSWYLNRLNTAVWDFHSTNSQASYQYLSSCYPYVLLILPYTGQMVESLHEIMNRHWFDIDSKKTEKSVAVHFNHPGYSITNLRVAVPKD